MREKLSKREKEKRKAERKERRAEAMAEMRRRAAMFGGTRIVKFDGHETVVPIIAKEQYTKKKKVERKNDVPPPIPTFSWNTTAQTMEKIEPVSIKEIEEKGKMGKARKAIKKAEQVGAKIETGRKLGENFFGRITENIVEGGLIPRTWFEKRKSRTPR